MTNERKLELLEDVMGVESGTLKPEMVLEDLLEWDSVAVISFLALVDDEFDKVIKASEVKAQKTVAGLMAIMEENQ